MPLWDFRSPEASSDAVREVKSSQNCIIFSWGGGGGGGGEWKLKCLGVSSPSPLDRTLVIVYAQG